MSWDDPVDIPRMMLRLGVGGTIHPDRACPDAYTAGGVLAEEGDVTLEEVIKGGKHDKLCLRGNCQSILSPGASYAIRGASAFHGKLELGDRPWRTNPQYLLNALDEVTHLLDLLEIHESPALKVGPVKARMREALAHIDQISEDPRWRRSLWEMLLNQSGDYYAETLQEKNLGKVTDMGLLAGAPRRPYTGPRGALVRALGDHDPYPRTLLVGPLGVLAHLTMEYIDVVLPNSVGDEVQLIRLPPDYDANMGEAVQGLFDPHGDGALQDLNNVVEAARKLS